jgi:hypothetical protein
MKQWLLLLMLLIFALLLASGGSSARAQTGAGFDLTWGTIDGGGVIHSRGGAFQVSASLGQPDAGPPMQGGAFTLTGGFLSGVPGQSEYRILLPLAVR